MKILFFGTEDFSAASLEALIDSGFDVAAVITKPDAPKGRGHKLTEPLVKRIAVSHDIPVWQPAKLNDIHGDIKALQPVAGVLVSYGRIIPQSIIDLFTPGIINVHPSLLPAYRGPSPIESAILNGDDTTGISIMRLSSKMDAGPVYHQVEHTLSGTETKPYLYKMLAEIGASELVKVLPEILNGSLTPREQNDELASYCNLLNKNDGVLDPSTMTAIDAERKVRAYLGFPKTRLNLFGHNVIITKASVAKEVEFHTDIRCHDGSVLRIEQLVGKSGKTMSTEAFVMGYLKK
jgi:methionyl-tRNA formyltransferase